MLVAAAASVAADASSYQQQTVDAYGNQQQMDQLEVMQVFNDDGTINQNSLGGLSGEQKERLADLGRRATHVWQGEGARWPPLPQT